MGQGLTRGAHGPIPLPAPATLQIIKGAPSKFIELQAETVTPTGAALMMAVADDFGVVPSLTIEQIGIGAGHKNWPDRPNIVRAIVGTAEKSKNQNPEGNLLLFETNIDDMNPELFAPLFDDLLEAGALDVWVTSAHFKKSRVGWVVSVLSSENLKDIVCSILLNNTTTLGIRWRNIDRLIVPREIQTVETRFGKVRVKVSSRPSAQLSIKPEYDDCLSLARQHKVGLQVIQEAAVQAFYEKTNRE